MKKLIRLFNILIFINFIFPSLLFAQDTIQKTFCMSAIGHESLDSLKKELLLNVKRHAVSELFGELITSFTKVDSSILTEKKIQSASAGFVRVKGNPYFENSINIGDVCVKIDAYATEEDQQKLKSVKLVKKYCATEPDLTTKQLKIFAKNQAIISSLVEYDRRLEMKTEEDLLNLVYKVKYLEKGFIPETETYCVKFEGIIYPIEILIINMSKPEIVQQWVSNVISYSNQFDDSGWSARQVIGKPNIFRCGDIRGSWTTNTGGIHFIEVKFEREVQPTKLIVRQNNSVGFVTKLAFLKPDGKYYSFFVEDKLKECPGNSIFELAGKIKFMTDTVKVYINADHATGSPSQHSTYEEIDAISLEGFLKAN